MVSTFVSIVMVLPVVVVAYESSYDDGNIDPNHFMTAYTDGLLACMRMHKLFKTELGDDVYTRETGISLSDSIFLSDDEVNKNNVELRNLSGGMNCSSNSTNCHFFRDRVGAAVNKGSEQPVSDAVLVAKCMGVLESRGAIIKHYEAMVQSKIVKNQNDEIMSLLSSPENLTTRITTLLSDEENFKNQNDEIMNLLGSPENLTTRITTLLSDEQDLSSLITQNWQGKYQTLKEAHEEFLAAIPIDIMKEAAAQIQSSVEGMSGAVVALGSESAAV